MERTDERRRRPPQGQPRRRPPGADHRQPPRRTQGQAHQRREDGCRSARPEQRRFREESSPRSQRPGQPRRSAAQAPRSRTREYEQPCQAPRSRAQEAPARRRLPREPQRRTYGGPAGLPPARRDEAQRHQRREQERRRRQRQQQRRTVSVLMLIVASMLAVFCLYSPEDGKLRLPRPNIEAHTEAPPPTEPPTDPPKPPIVVTPISSLEDLATLQVPDYVSVQIIDVDGDSRRGSKLNAINDIVLHYVGNPGTTGQQNRDWYADLYSDVSSHFVVGLQGEVIQCIPLDEKSSASNDRNGDTISIEVCHPDASGKFNDETYESVVDLLAWLVLACDLDIDNVIRHYEVTGKICPKYYVENEDAWVKLRADVAARMAQ